MIGRGADSGEAGAPSPVTHPMFFNLVGIYMNSSGFILGLVTIAIGLIISCAFFPKDLWDDQKVLVMCNLVLAFGVIVSIVYSQMNWQIMRKDSAISKRPYAFIDAKTNTRLDPDSLSLFFTLKNSGVSTANKIDFTVKKALLINSLPANPKDREDLYKEGKAGNQIDGEAIYKNLEISIFPQQELSTEGVVFTAKNLESLLKGGKAIFALVVLSYQGLPFDNHIESYKVNYQYSINWNTSSNSLSINLISKEVSTN